MSELSRHHELLADLATTGLDEADARELAELGDDDLSFELAAAAADLALFNADQEMPALLRKRIERDGVAPNAEVATPVRRPLVPWLVAAVCAAAVVVVIALGALREPKPTIANDNRDLSERRDTLVAAGGALDLSWEAGPDSTARGFVGGDVVWNDARQEGYMRFRGLAANDPTQFQYQLWIFDPSRDERYPVDGGVFNVDGSGEAIVAIDARLPVAKPTLFVVTVERPGGVVVSTRERIAAVAKRL